MPLSFLVPAFLAGLAALAVPVIIHLARRQPDQAVEFPSLMFIRQVPHRSTQRRRLRHLLLLAMRCAAIAIIVLAFARPFLDRPVAIATPLMGGGREVVILLDRSQSMAYGDRWERAVRAARDAIDGLAQADRATLVLFDEQPEAATQPTYDRAVLRGALADARPGAGSTRFAAALKLAESNLASSAMPRREVILISDFQQTGWGTQAEGARVALPPGTVVTPIAVGDSAANLAVAGVEFARETYEGRERVKATARLVNTGGEPLADVPVALELAGRPVERRTVSLAPKSSATVEFAPFTLSQANTRGTVVAGDDGLPEDNRHHFVLSPGEAIGVVVLEGADAGAEASLYLTRALAIGRQPAFRVTVRPAGGLQLADLTGNAVVVLNDAPLPGGEIGQRLRTWVENGGGLVALMGEASGRAPADGPLPEAASRPVELGSAAGAALGYLDYSHPIFEAFNTPRGGDFASARFFGYRPLAEREGDRTLARFGDGSAALVERRVGRGRVLAWASTLDNDWNDLALQPVYLPFVHRVVQYAAGYAPPEPAVLAGTVLDASRYRLEQGDRFALAPSGQRLPLGDSTPLVLREQGVYELRTGRLGGSLAGAVAVNLDPAEADLTPLDPAELISAVRSPEPAGGGAAVAAEVSVAERERSQTIWWYLLMGAFALLAAETVISNRLARATR